MSTTDTDDPGENECLGEHSNIVIAEEHVFEQQVNSPLTPRQPPAQDSTAAGDQNKQENSATKRTRLVVGDDFLTNISKGTKIKHGIINIDDLASAVGHGMCDLCEDTKLSVRILEHESDHINFEVLCTKCDHVFGSYIEEQQIYYVIFIFVIFK